MPPLDDNYQNRIPDAVRRASMRADEIAREIGVANTPPEETPPPADEQVPVDAPPDEVPVDGPPADAPPVDVPPPPVEDWEKRYRTLQGKYDAEIPALRAQINSLEHLIANLRTPEPSAPQPPADTRTQSVTIPPEDVETFGEDLITAARRWARAEFEPRIARLEQELGTLRTGQSTIQQETAQHRVMSSLDADPQLGGKWREINVQPEFIAWLDQVDPFSGEQRMRLLSDAFARGDANRTGQFFRAFMAEHTAVTSPPPAATLTHTSTPDVEAGKVSLESLAAPGRSSGSAPGGAPEKRIWTKQDITAFYRDRAQGKYRHREDEALRQEADLFAATSEGRIRS